MCVKIVISTAKHEKVKMIAAKAGLGYSSTFQMLLPNDHPPPVAVSYAMLDMHCNIRIMKWEWHHRKGYACHWGVCLFESLFLPMYVYHGFFNHLYTTITSLDHVGKI